MCQQECFSLLVCKEHLYLGTKRTEKLLPQQFAMQTRSKIHCTTLNITGCSHRNYNIHVITKQGRSYIVMEQVRIRRDTH